MNQQIDRSVSAFHCISFSADGAVHYSGVMSFLY